MNMDGIQLFHPIDPTTFPGLSGTGAAPAAPAAGKTDFQQLLLKGMDALNLEQVESTRQVESFMRGQGPDLHTVMLTVEQANLSLEFAVQVRNKVVEAYNEIMRIQV